MQWQVNLHFLTVADTFFLACSNTEAALYFSPAQIMSVDFDCWEFVASSGKWV
jgi:hypothetical protein